MWYWHMSVVHRPRQAQPLPPDNSTFYICPHKTLSLTSLTALNARYICYLWYHRAEGLVARLWVSKIRPVYRLSPGQDNVKLFSNVRPSITLNLYLSKIYFALCTRGCLGLQLSLGSLGHLLKSQSISQCPTLMWVQRLLSLVCILETEIINFWFEVDNALLVDN